MSDSTEAYGWLSLSLYSHAEDMLLRGSGVLTPDGEVLFGLDRHEARHLLVPVPADHAIEPLTGEALRVGVWENNGHTGIPDRFLDLRCTSSQLADVFAVLADNVLGRIREIPNEAPSALLAALDEWQRLLHTSRGLGSDQARGLFGELVVLKELARTNAPKAVERWTGPDKELHDFTTTRGDIEVKTSASDGMSVIISSLIQLDRIGPAPLVLVRVAVQSSPQGQSIDELVEELVSMGCPSGPLARRLSTVGHVPGLEDAERFVQLVPLRGWLVGDDFPALRKSDIPPSRRDAISGVSYTVNLAAAPSELSQDELEAWFHTVVSA